MTCQKPSKAEAFRLRVANPVWGAKHGVGDQPLGRARCALAGLFASALAALGTADASPAQHQKPLWQHRSKAAEAEGRKDGTQRDAKQSNAARLRAREAHAVVPNVPLPVARPAAASLPPDLATTKVAIELIRDGKWKDATTFAASIGDPVARKLVEWALLRHSDSEAGFERYVAGKPILTGRASGYCADAPRRGCGRSDTTAQRCANSSARNRPVRLADLRWHAC